MLAPEILSASASKVPSLRGASVRHLPTRLA